MKKANIKFKVSDIGEIRNKKRTPSDILADYILIEHELGQFAQSIRWNISKINHQGRTNDNLTLVIDSICELIKRDDKPQLYHLIIKLISEKLHRKRKEPLREDELSEIYAHVALLKLEL